MKVIVICKHKCFAHDNVKSWGYNKRTGAYEICRIIDGKIHLDIYHNVDRVIVEGAEDEKTNIL